MHTTLRIARLILCAVAWIIAVSPIALAFEMDTVVVGDPGNAPDVRLMNDGTCCYGAVPYQYRIGKYEVTNEQYAAFLNAVASNGDTYEVYEPTFMGGAHYGGIVRSGGGGNYLYTVKPNMGNKPVLGVTNGAARRFVNWLHNGRPNGNQVPGITETGAYDLTGLNWQQRSAGASWFLPTENEWYKAAFYDPRDVPSGGVPGHYALYATGSLVQPTIATADAVGNIANPGVNTANYLQGANWNGSAPFGHVTTVGSAGPLAASYYGTFDQSGNVDEFTENVSVRGGHFASLQDALSADVRFGNAFLGYAGFRVGTILNPPDPASGLIAYWNAENGAVDVTGNGHDGTFQGNAATIAAGPFGNAFTFDGVGDHIHIGDELDMVDSDFTLTAWLQGDPSMGAWGRIFDKGYFSGYTLGRQASSNQIGFEFLASGSQGNGFGTTSPLIDNTWHHVALVKSGTTVTIYADGVAENSQSVSAALQNGALPLLIGYNPGEGIQGFWKGLLDELRIYDRALTVAEVALLALNPGDDLLGDYNQDGSVDAADYTVWRDNFGSTTSLPNDDSSGVGPDDYTRWKNNFGNSAGAASSAPGSAGGIMSVVPEPVGFVNLLSFALAILALRRRRTEAKVAELVPA